jgi:hypothetical protein
MNTYEVTFKIPNKEAFVEFVDKVGPVVGRMEVVVSNPNATTATAPKKAPPLRGSKVNDTILAALHNSTLTTRQLKDALENAGLSAGSLSTGIAALTATKQIERIGEGVYALAGYREAAE